MPIPERNEIPGKLLPKAWLLAQDEWWANSLNCLLSDARRLLESVPIRLSCLHHCADRTFINEINAQAIKLAFKGGLRIQVHLEDAWELRYKLMSYGIPIEGMLQHGKPFISYLTHSPWHLTMPCPLFSTSCHRNKQCQNKEP